MSSYPSLAPAMNALKEKGFDHDFNIEKDCIYSQKTGTYYKPEEFNVIEVHRFEGQSNPADSTILFAIETGRGDKGLLVDAYGADAHEVGPELKKKLNITGDTKAE